MQVYCYPRHDYTKTFDIIGHDENNDPIFDETPIYTGKVINVLYDHPVNRFAIPEWKEKLTATYNAEKGHTGRGRHAYLYNRQPITILS
jgi:hypothetical protein